MITEVPRNSKIDRNKFPSATARQFFRPLFPLFEIKPILTIFILNEILSLGLNFLKILFGLGNVTFAGSVRYAGFRNTCCKYC